MTGAEKKSGIALDAENAVIGALLIDESILKDMLFAVREADFGLKINREIFHAAKDLYFRGKSITAFTIRDRLGKEAEAYMVQLLEITTTSANWREYAAIMSEQAAMRRMQLIALEIAGAGSAAECRELAAKLRQEQNGEQRAEVYSMADIMTRFQARQMAEEAVKYIQTGIAGVDDLTFLRPGKVVVIGGRPSDGKTLLALQMARCMAEEWRVGFFSLETDEEDLGDRIIAELADIDLAAIKRRELTEEDWTRLAGKSQDAEALKLSIINASGFNAEDIMSYTEALGLDVIFVDYIQLTRPSSTRLMRSEQIAEISRALHIFAQQSKTLVVELAQLSRPERPQGTKKGQSQEDQYYREASMFDLKESGQLEQDADVILLLSRPNKADGYDPKKQRRLRIEKNKNGRTGSMMLYLDGAHQSFIPISDETARDVEFEKKIMEQNARRERMIGAKRR